MDFTAYVAERRPRLVRTAVLLGCPPADAEDVVQSALLRCYRSWRRVTAADRPDAYVHRVLVTTLYDARQRRWNGARTARPPIPGGPRGTRCAGRWPRSRRSTARCWC
ncbi:sigma factor [Pimelobacter simplex]|uniref:sigma factor n=1 Tax=Nocardioides simplex TaxID=2045 RepID=UPI003AAAB4F8